MRGKARGDGQAEPDISIIIINWNTAKLLEGCLTSIIQNARDVCYEVVIIDNHSAGTDFKRVKQKFSQYPNFTWIENDKNIGGLAANQALPHCRGRYLLILGPDTIVPPQSLKRMVDFLDNNKEAGAVTAKLLNPDRSPQNYYYKFWNLRMVFFSTAAGVFIDEIFLKGRFRRYYFGGDIDSSKITIVEQPAAACFMLRWDSVSSDYLVDEDFPFYFNDVDLCKRIYRNGYKIFLLPSAEVIHFSSSSFKRADSGWKARERRSSLIKYFKKYHKTKVPFLILILIPHEVIRFIYKKLYSHWTEYLKKELFDCDTVLDLGCGYNSPIQRCSVPFSVGVEFFEPYLDESNKKGIHNEYIKADIMEIEFEAKSFDVTLCLDVLEHLTKKDGYELIKKMEKWARRKIIVTTPNEYLWQAGYDNNILQQHKSGWSVKELRELGFKVYGIGGWKKLRGYRGTMKYKPSLLWAGISYLTQIITYWYPRLAFKLFATKQLNKK